MHKSDKTRHAFDEYATPRVVVEQALAQIRGEPENILDVGAGRTGIWGKEARRLWPGAGITGVDIQTDFDTPEGYDWFFRMPIEEFLGSTFQGGKYDLIIGNPPFKNIDYVLPKCLEQLRYGGTLCFLLRLAYLEGQRRRDTLYQKTPPEKVVVLSRRPQFYGNGNYRAYGLFYWRAHWEGETRISWL
jgi:hypothetical protein